MQPVAPDMLLLNAFIRGLRGAPSARSCTSHQVLLGSFKKVGGPESCTRHQVLLAGLFFSSVVKLVRLWPARLGLRPAPLALLVVRVRVALVAVAFVEVSLLVKNAATCRFVRRLSRKFLLLQA